MLSNLLLAVGLTATIGATTPLNSSTETFYQDVTVTETYEYETNDVNSIDDLIEGNIYKVNVSNLKPNGEQIMNLSYLRFENQGLNKTQVIVSQTTGVLTYEFLSNDTLRLKYYAEIDNTSVVYFLPIPIIDNSIEFYAVYQLPHLTRTNVTFSRSDYLGEHTVTVTPREYEGLYTSFENFLHERLFSGGELDQIEFTVFNSTLTMGQWLSTTTAIVILCLIIALLIMFLKWIFKIVGGAFLWK